MTLLQPPAPGPAAIPSTYRFRVNGAPVELAAPGGRRLLDVLRLELGLTGTKEGCGEGECGACAVLVDGVLVNSCLVPVCQVDGREVRTVEGLATDDALDPVQAAFVEADATQCGICTPGMLMAARAFLDSGAEPTDEGIRDAIAGNLCRCTGYMRIVEAIARAATPGTGSPSAGRTVGRAPAPRPRRAAAPPGAAPIVHPARTLGEALRLVADGARPIAGGTDLMVALAAGALPDRPLVDLWGLDELRAIVRDGEVLVVGALATYAALRRSPLVAECLPALGEAAASVGAAAIQNRGTIGGNAVTASPAGDMLPILLATDASLVVAGPGGERAIPAATFWTGYRRTALAPGELLVRIRIPVVPGREVRFRKVGTRRAQAIAKVSMAVAWRPDGRAWRDVRVALGSVAERPIRATGTEALLEGGRPSRALADAAAAAIETEIRPIDDIRSTASYRRTVAGRILRRMVLEAIGG